MKKMKMRKCKLPNISFRILLDILSIILRVLKKFSVNMWRFEKFGSIEKVIHNPATDVGPLLACWHPAVPLSSLQSRPEFAF